jgi:sugar/nucleoside kinase (ribokinase family)
MLKPLNLDLGMSRYRVLIGTGGIGTGVFFRLNGDHILGREESRSGHFLDQRDYCKLHIIAHYVKTLAGPAFMTIPIGRVGADKEGQQLLHEMTEAGLDLRHVEAVAGGQTLFSFCFVYPDGSGGNLTTDNSVNASADAVFVGQAEPEFRAFRGQGIALAAPEVSLEARLRLLELGSQYDFLRVASLTAEEIHSPLAAPILALTDLFAGNISEAAALAGVEPLADDPSTVAQEVMTRLRAVNPAVQGLITAGAQGSWGWDSQRLYHEPAISVQPVSTAGAGDAHLAGLIVGLIAGLSMADALKLGVLTAALSVTSPHTIHPTLDRNTLRAFVAQHQVHVSPAIMALLEDDPLGSE